MKKCDLDPSYLSLCPKRDELHTVSTTDYHSLSAINAQPINKFVPPHKMKRWNQAKKLKPPSFSTALERGSLFKQQK
jgi:hypothetical protein